MNAETIRNNILNNQAWLERALLALAKANVWHDEQDRKTGTGMVNWINRRREQKVAIGQCLTGDYHMGRARHLAQGYVNELIQIAYDKASADAERYYEAARKAKKRARELKKELMKVKYGKDAATPAPTAP